MKWMNLAIVAGSPLLCSPVVAQAAKAVDWRSRAELGLEVLYEWEFLDDSQSPQGGGTRFEVSGTLLDRVYAEEGGDFLIARTITRRQGTQRSSDVCFLRLLPDGLLTPDAPLESFLWCDGEMDFPIQDALGPPELLTPGVTCERQVELLDPMFAAIHPEPIAVIEDVERVPPAWLQERFPAPAELEEAVKDLSRNAPERLHARLRRRLAATGEPDSASEESGIDLLALEDTCLFDPRAGVILERTLMFRYTRGANPMIQTRQRSMREVASESEPFLDSESLLTLRAAWRVASSHPREAGRLLGEWARSGLDRARRDEDLAAQIWSVCAQAEREHSRAVEWARREGPEADAALTIADEDSFEALRRGRLSRLFTTLELDGSAHRAAYRASRERRQLSSSTVAFLMRVHGEANSFQAKIPEPQRAQAKALFQASLEELQR